MSIPTPRKYKIGTCYGCQKCLFCFIDLKNNSCSCNLNIKPSRSSTIPDRTVRGQQIHNRCYRISTTHLPQIAWLKKCNKYFGYLSNFNIDFDMTFCSACNSKYDRAKSSKTAKTSNKSQSNAIEVIEVIDDDIKPIIIEEVIDDDIKHVITEEVIDDDMKLAITELKVKVIIDTKKSNLPFGKWFTFTTESIENFYLFQLNLSNHIQKYLDAQIKNDYDISYKVNGRGQAMCINDEEDFSNFICECKEFINSTKKMYIYISMKQPINQKRNIIRDNEEIFTEKSSKRLKTNYISKESDLDEIEHKQAQVITELRLKYKCFHHITPCYVEDGRHLQLNTARLVLWARDIVCKAY